MKRTIRAISLLTCVLLVAAPLTGTAIAKKKKAPKGPVVVGTDPADDWGDNADPTIAPLGGPLGAELIEGAIEKADAKTLNFIIKVAQLPPNGGWPEVMRYVWTMTVNNEMIQLDGKWLNYTRGACDPTAGTCPPPRDPGQAPFAVRGDCTSNGGAAVTCSELGLVNATFDAASGTITIPVPMAMLKAKPGTKIANGSQPDSGFTGIWAIPSVFASQASMPLDELIPTKVYTVPKG